MNRCIEEATTRVSTMIGIVELAEFNVVFNHPAVPIVITTATVPVISMIAVMRMSPRSTQSRVTISIAARAKSDDESCRLASR